MKTKIKQIGKLTTNQSQDLTTKASTSPSKILNTSASLNKSQRSKSPRIPTEEADINKNSPAKNYKKLPKNVNDYRHIIEEYDSRESDVEWILGLRGYKKIKSFPKAEASAPPAFYEDDLANYKKRNDYGSNRKYLKANMAVFSHIYDHPAGLPANSSGIKYATNLRDIENSKMWKNPNQWKYYPIPKEKNIFDTYLPPVTSNGRSILNGLGLKVSRPIEQIVGVRILFN